MVRLAEMWSQLQLEPEATTPLYRQLFEKIRDKILTGDLSSGSRIPATRELAGLIGLNRTTVSAAYELLEREGFLRAHVGRGSFVERPTPLVTRPDPARYTDPSLARSRPIISFAPPGQRPTFFRSTSAASPFPKSLPAISDGSSNWAPP